MSYMSMGICVEGDADYGRTAVSQMMNTYTGIAKGLTTRAAFAAFYDKFDQPVQSIKKSLDELEAKWKLPFSTIKCSMADLGKKAEELTKAMLQSQGSYAPKPTEPHKPLAPLGDMTKLLFYGALAVGAVMVLPTVLKSVREMKGGGK